MRVLICDDEPLARERLARLLAELPDVTVVGQAANGLEALSMVQQQLVDVLLLDIRMPEMDGVETARHLLTLPRAPAVIFCTAYDEHALEAFRVQALDYLLKPVSREQLKQALERARALTQAEVQELARQPVTGSPAGRRHISARTHKGIELIPVADIRYFLADQKYVTVRHSDGEVLIDQTLKERAEELGDNFVRIHRNALVALAWLEGLELAEAGHHQVRFRGIPDRLAGSRRHVAEVRRMMARL